MPESTDEKLKLLAEPARFEVSDRRARKDAGLFKVLMTNRCERSCAFCPAAANRDVPRAGFAADELADTFAGLHAAGLASGLFLSSGICGTADQTMESMIDAVQIVRERHAFEGYVHLKVMPGASDEAIRAAVACADRVSVNLDVPNATRMACVEASRDWDTEVAGTLARVQETARELKEAGVEAADVSTALVVGASGETDVEILDAMRHCYETLDVRRVYFGRFQPVGGTAMETMPETPARRVQRLSEADFLVRRYGFRFEDFQPDETGHLDLSTDPKIAAALSHPDDFPVEVTTAPRESLLRVPGVGELSIRRILRARAEGGVRDAGDLQAMGVVVRRAAPFLTIAGRKPETAFASPGSTTGSTLLQPELF